jgi:hypothetical protein
MEFMRFKLCCALILLTACAAKHPLIEDLSGRENLSMYALDSVHGARDGDHLTARAILSDGSSTLTLEMQFLVGPNTTLQSGTWQWMSKSGAVSERSVTFLGGQSGPPSVGGRFDLLGSAGTPEYRVTLPVTPVVH